MNKKIESQGEIKRNKVRKIQGVLKIRDSVRKMRNLKQRKLKRKQNLQNLNFKMIIKIKEQANLNLKKTQAQAQRINKKKEVRMNQTSIREVNGNL